MISPLELNGAITRTQDYSAIKINEDNHSSIGQHIIQEAQDQKHEESAIFVQNADDANQPDTHHDAKEKGKNEYVDMRSKERKKKLDTEGIVVNKTFTGFDMKI